MGSDPNVVHHNDKYICCLPSRPRCRPSGDFGISVLNSYPCYLAVYAWPATLPRQTQDSLQILWLAAYLMGLPPTGLYTLRWTHGLTPMCFVINYFVWGLASVLSPEWWITQKRIYGFLRPGSRHTMPRLFTLFCLYIL